MKQAAAEARDYHSSKPSRPFLREEVEVFAREAFKRSDRNSNIFAHVCKMQQGSGQNPRNFTLLWR